HRFISVLFFFACFFFFLFFFFCWVFFFVFFPPLALDECVPTFEQGCSLHRVEHHRVGGGLLAIRRREKKGFHSKVLGQILDGFHRVCHLHPLRTHKSVLHFYFRESN